MSSTRFCFFAPLGSPAIGAEVEAAIGTLVDFVGSRFASVADRLAGTTGGVLVLPCSSAGRFAKFSSDCRYPEDDLLGLVEVVGTAAFALLLGCSEVFVAFEGPEDDAELVRRMDEAAAAMADWSCVNRLPPFESAPPLFDGRGASSSTAVSLGRFAVLDEPASRPTEACAGREAVAPFGPAEGRVPLLPCEGVREVETEVSRESPEVVPPAETTVGVASLMWPLKSMSRLTACRRRRTAS